MAKSKGKRVELTNDTLLSLLPPLPLNATDGQLREFYTAATGDSHPVLISRNKHWKHISMYHGQWLQFSREQLDLLLAANHSHPRPKPFDPAMLNDLRNIRVAVDEAIERAVNAASGVAPITHPAQFGRGMRPGADAFGFAYSGNGVSSRLTRERIARMRDLAVQKLAMAYHLDEIATSVATMHSPTLDEIAKLSLTRNPNNTDAKYVQFFHEKIPSRKIAEFSPVHLLSSLAADAPLDAAYYRTRAVLHLFKGQYEAAIRELTDGLKDLRLLRPSPSAFAPYSHVAHNENDATGLEAQLLFYRGNSHLQLSMKKIPETIKMFRLSAKTPENLPFHTRHVELRKQVKTNARRAIRNYLSFLSHLEYTPNHKKTDPPLIYRLSDLFNSTPPTTLPPFPPEDVDRYVNLGCFDEDEGIDESSPERVTFHPLLPEVLCSLLIAHLLLQTPTAELRRHTYNAARLVRHLSGSPFFLVGRSTAAATWLDVLRCTGNFLGLKYSWLSLCGREIALTTIGWLPTAEPRTAEQVRQGLCLDEEVDASIEAAKAKGLTLDEAIRQRAKLEKSPSPTIAIEDEQDEQDQQERGEVQEQEEQGEQGEEEGEEQMVIPSLKGLSGKEVVLAAEKLATQFRNLKLIKKKKWAPNLSFHKMKGDMSKQVVLWYLEAPLSPRRVGNQEQ